MQRAIIAIWGQTGVGKSDFAEYLGRHLPIDIINMDVGQFYTPFTIGTAKPAWRESAIPHIFFDLINEPRDFSVSEYRKLVSIQIESSWKHGRLPVLVGGSGFYLFSLFYPPHAQPSIPKVIQGTWNDLFMLDPERAKQIHPNDIYRIHRALALIQADEKKLASSWSPSFNPIAPYIILDCVRDRDDLYGRINKRVEVMMDQGWVQEVEAIRHTPWESFLHHKKLIGYLEILDFLNQKTSYQELIEDIQKKTRWYAKRQGTFGRMLKKKLAKEEEYIRTTGSEWQSFNLTLSSVDLYINQLLKHPLIAPFKD